MAKSFKDVVQNSARMGLGMPVETKNPLSRTNIRSRTTLPSSIRPGLPSAAIFPLGKPTSQVRPGRRTAGAGPNAISTGPPHCFAPDAHRALSSSSPG